MNAIRKHREKVLAELAAHNSAANGEETLEGHNAYDLMLAKLSTDKTMLKGLKSLKLRGVKKQSMCPEYDAYVDGIIAADETVQDDVLVTMLAWNVDAGNFSRALAIGAHAIKHGLSMPSNYNRTPAAVLAEQIAEAAIKSHEDSNQPSVDFELLKELEALTEPVDMEDQIKSKLMKSLGLAHEKLALTDENVGTYEHQREAVGYFKTALSLDPKAGVKKRMEALGRTLKKADEAEASSTA